MMSRMADWNLLRGGVGLGCETRRSCCTLTLSPVHCGVSELRNTVDHLTLSPLGSLFSLSMLQAIARRQAAQLAKLDLVEISVRLLPCLRRPQRST